jgi:TusA-related sulfurtransferase
MGADSSFIDPTPSAVAHRAAASRSASSLGEQFVAALADRDSKRLEACFQSQARLRALVPPGPQEHRGAQVIARVFTAWFGDADTIQVLDSTSELLADRLHLRYRFREAYKDGDSELIEQDAFCIVDEGRILAMDLVCSGHRPESREGNPELHRFDAGELGCGSGLPREFRSQISAIPVGSTLEVTTRDPSAKEDLPSLARMLGHEVLSVRSSPDGGAVITVRRGT